MGKCINCKKETEKTIRLSFDDGFCKSSTHKFLCKNCHKPKLIGSNFFVKIGNEIFRELNGRFGMFGCLEHIRSKNEFNYYVDEGKYELLDGAKFGMSSFSYNFEEE